ncbi:MAG: hypothetical protein FJ399_00435 [Verrucomicrobia bacterium]|nr:hypothetical protein [Verrucomicrobiota bacterium]
MTAATRIAEFVIEKAADEPMMTRAQLYRDLASLVVDENTARALIALSVELEQIERRHEQLVLDFKKAALR